MAEVIALTGSPWTRGQLLKAYDMASRNARLEDIGRRVGRSAGDVDLALWAILCTERVGQALELLNGQGHGGERRPAVVAP